MSEYEGSEDGLLEDLASIDETVGLSIEYDGHNYEYTSSPSLKHHHHSHPHQVHPEGQRTPLVGTVDAEQPHQLQCEAEVVEKRDDEGKW